MLDIQMSQGMENINFLLGLNHEVNLNFLLVQQNPLEEIIENKQ